MKVIVVDDAPADSATRFICEHFSQVRYVLEPGPGLSRAAERRKMVLSGPWLTLARHIQLARRGTRASLFTR